MHGNDIVQAKEIWYVMRDTPVRIWSFQPLFGDVAQLVRAADCRSAGCRIVPCHLRHFLSHSITGQYARL